MHGFPPPQGLYDGLHEHDACGAAFVATLTGKASHDIVAKAITALRNLEHRGATGAEPDSGDGAGILLGIPDAFFRAVVDFDLPQPRAYAVGTAFLSGDADEIVIGVHGKVRRIERPLRLPWREHQRRCLAEGSRAQGTESRRAADQKIAATDEA